MVRVKVRYKAQGATSEDPADEVTVALAPEEVAGSGEDLGDDFMWVAAVGTLAEILRESPFASDDELSLAVQEIKRQADRDVDRGELASLIDRVQSLR